jgi:hypothetical protein
MIISTVGGALVTALSSAVGYVWKGQAIHDVRIARLETRVDSELAHINRKLDGLDEKMDKVCDTIARANL